MIMKSEGIKQHQYSHFIQEFATLRNVKEEANTSEGDQLSELLKTNRILIENKKSIYTAKIRAYATKIHKMQKLLHSITDEDDRISLQEKLIITESRRNQAVAKLNNISKMEMKMDNLPVCLQNGSLFEITNNFTNKSEEIFRRDNRVHRNRGNENKAMWSESDEQCSKYGQLKTLGNIVATPNDVKSKNKEGAHSSHEIEEIARILNIKLATNLFDEDASYLAAIKSVLIQKQEQDRAQKQHQQKNSKILDNQKHEIEDMVETQRALLQQIDELKTLKNNAISELFEQISIAAEHLSIPISQKHPIDFTAIQEISQSIRKCLQAQKLTALEKKQAILMLEYEANTLKNQISKRTNSLQHLSSSVSQQQHRLGELQKQCDRLEQEKQAMAQQTARLSDQIIEYQDLSGIRRNCYNELEGKYEKLKSKKGKLENCIKNIQSQMKELSEKREHILQSIDRKQGSLKNVQEELKASHYEKEQMVRKLSAIDDEVYQKAEKLAMLETNIGIKSEKLRKLEKKVSALDERVESESKKLQVLEGKNGQLLDAISECEANLAGIQRRKSEQDELLLQMKKVIDEKSQKVQILSRQHEQLAQSVSERQLAKQMLEEEQKNGAKNIEHLAEQILKLESVKEQLQEAIASILDKKQELFTDIQNKYETVSHLEQETEQLSKQLSAGGQKLQRLTEQCMSTERRRMQVEKQRQQAQQKLEEMLAEIAECRDEQQNTRERVGKLKKVQTKLVLEIAVNNSALKPANSKWIQEQVTSAEISDQIEQILGELRMVGQLKEKYSKEKQENRKLKLDNDRLRKLAEIDESLFM